MSNTKNTITQEYDALNRIRKAFYPNDRDNTRKVMKPTYNKGGALLSLKVDTTDYVREVAYNARGQRILIAYGNKIMTRYAYDPKTFRVLRQRSALFNHSGHTYTPNAGIRQDMQYTYDLEGTITSMNDAAPANTYAQGPGNLLRLFTHDPLRRLLSATGREISNVYSQPSWDLNIRPMDYTDTNTYIRTYRYDKIGNIQNLNHSANGHANQDFNRDYSYDSSDNKLKSFTVNSTTYGNSYDPNGNLTKEGQSRYYEWGANDKLAVFKNQAGTSTPSVYTNYFYNAQGDRIKKHTRKGNKIVVTFYMDGGMFETSYTKTVGGGIDNNRFYNTIKISDDGALIATIRVGNNVDDGTFAIKYIVGDYLNNSTAVLKTTGSLINREEYYPFGETSFGGFQFKRYRFNGKEKDEESGLYEYGQRYYAPWLCRFVSVDPIAESFPHLSSYNYASNRPITARDLEGLQAQDEGSGDKTGGAQTDSNRNLTGEYVVKPDQGPTQIAEDLAKVHGVDIDWVKTIDDPRNQKYFEHITGEERYNEHNKSYENLNMNPGDIIYFDILDPKMGSENNEFMGPLQNESSADQATYSTQNLTLKGSIKGAGPFVYAWSRFTVKPSSGSGFYESEVRSSFSGSVGLGDIAGSRLTIEINKQVLDSLQTNSLTEIMEYGSNEVTSHWGGWGFFQTGTFEGFSEKGERVWRAETTLGFNLGYSPPQTSMNMKWENKYPSLQDSLRNAQKSIELGNGNISDFRKFISKHK